MTCSDNFWALCSVSAQSVLDNLKAEREAALNGLPGMVENPAAPYTLVDGIAVIRIDGPIDRETRYSWFTGQAYTAGQKEIRASLASAMTDRSVKGILLAINSPGGVVAGTKELADFIADCAKSKPLAAYVDGMAASAAFWLAAATGEVMSPVTAQTGSIGVIAIVSDHSKANEKYGVTRAVIHSGKWKAAGSPDKSLTDEERALFQAQIESLHAIFIRDVAARLALPLPADAQNLPEWAEGQTFLATEASSLGLVAQIVQDMDDALSRLSAKVQNGEKFMTLEELKIRQPELVDALANELAQTQAATLADAATLARKETLELVACVGGRELAQKIEKIFETGVSASQYKALASTFAATTATPQASGDAAKREEILKELQAAHSGPLPGASGANPQMSALIADAERRNK